MYEGLYTKVGIPRRVARELWRRTVGWVRAGRRGRRPVLSRQQLRIALHISETQEAAFKDAIDSLGENLRILGFRRSKELLTKRKVLVNADACTFEIQGRPHLVMLSGPTGRDRKDGEHNSLWLEPLFEPIDDVAPVLTTPNFPELEYFGFTLLRFSEREYTTPRMLAPAFIAAANAFAFAMNGAESLLEPSPTSSDDEIVLQSEIVTEHWSATASAVIGSVDQAARSIGCFGAICAALDERQRGMRARLTATLDAMAPMELSEFTLKFKAPPGAVHGSMSHIGEHFVRVSLPVISASQNGVGVLVAPGVELHCGLCTSVSEWWWLTLTFSRTEDVNLWRSVRLFDLAAVTRGLTPLPAAENGASG